jgi:hypothetical protein
VTEGPDELFDELIEILVNYNRVDLAAGAGALQLFVPNAHHLFRLNILSAALVGVAGSDANAIMSSGRWRQLVNQPPLADEAVVRLEDPLNDVFVEELTLPLGSFRISSGVSDQSVLMLQTLLEALVSDGPAMDATVQARATRLGLGVLVMADLVYRRANLPRGTAAPSRRDGPVEVPPAAQFQTLKRAVQLSVTELSQHLERHHLRIADLAPLTTSGAYRQPRAEPGAVPRPILQVDDQFVVVAPSALARAACHGIVGIVSGGNDRERLQERCLHTAHRHSAESLSLLGFAGTDRSAPSPLAFTGAESLHPFDSDKVAYLLVIGDDLFGYDPDLVDTEASLGELAQPVADRIGEIERFVFSEYSGCNAILHIVVLQSTGRPGALHLPDTASPTGSPILALTPRDLMVIAYLEHDRHLVLWQWATARDDLWRQGVRIHRWFALDEFALWRSHRYSFYVTDGRRPTDVNIDLYGVGQLREEVYSKYDVHGALGPDSTDYIEVVKIAPEATLPIYAPIHQPTSLSLLVETGAIPIWLVVDSAAYVAELHDPYVSIMHAVAFWTAELRRDLLEILSEVANQQPRMVVGIQLLEPDHWPPERQGELVDDLIVVDVIAEDRVQLQIRPQILNVLSRRDNSGDRLLARAVVESFLRIREVTRDRG